jgi:hypothetical protein
MLLEMLLGIGLGEKNGFDDNDEDMLLEIDDLMLDGEYEMLREIDGDLKGIDILIKSFTDAKP